jgi:3-hydroxyisobutyrate dehydrogenase
MIESSPSSQARIGFIGIGGMGSRMARRLITAGYDVAVYDRTKAHADEIGRQGARLAKSPRELATSVDFVLSSLTNDAAVTAVMYGSDGALKGARRGTVFIDLSTVSPRTSIQLSDAGRAAGMDVLDAPVSGSLPQAEQGQLVIFVGGSHGSTNGARQFSTCSEKLRSIWDRQEPDP